MDVGASASEPLAAGIVPGQDQRGIVARALAQGSVDRGDPLDLGVDPEDRPRVDASPKLGESSGLARSRREPIRVDPEGREVEPLDPAEPQLLGLRRARDEHRVEAGVAGPRDPIGGLLGDVGQASVDLSDSGTNRVGEIAVPVADQRGSGAEPSGRDLDQRGQQDRRTALDHVGAVELDQLTQAPARDQARARAAQPGHPRAQPAHAEARELLPQLVAQPADVLDQRMSAPLGPVARVGLNHDVAQVRTGAGELDLLGQVAVRVIGGSAPGVADVEDREHGHCQRR